MRSLNESAAAVASGTSPQQAHDAQAGGGALRVSVVNGNLLFIEQPLLLGHYCDAALTGVEGVVDELMSGILSTSLRLGRYPQTIGAQQVFVNAGRRVKLPCERPRPEGAIVVGLGSEGQLTAGDLVMTVRLGVIAWAQRLSEAEPDRSEPFELAATLVGSGGTGIAPGQAARLVVEGVYEANQMLARVTWPGVSHLRLIELFMDRSTEAWRALRLMEQATPGRIQLEDEVLRDTGGLSRPLDNTYRGTDYDLFSAVTEEDRSGEQSIVYTLDTRRARTEVRATATQGRLIRQLVKSASSADNSDPGIGRILFQLLIPREMHPFLAGGSDMQIEVDDGTAGIPWELLDNTGGDASGKRDINAVKPWAIRAKLLRKLRTKDFRGRVDDADRDAQMLVIGEPYIDDPRYRRLPGARAEAEAVARMLAQRLTPAQVRALVARSDDDVGADARTIVSALLEREWRVLHVSGHGEPPANEAPGASNGDRLRGIVLSDGIYLGAREIAALRRVPELVFVNCCHLAERNEDQLMKDPTLQYDRPRFAATVAEELIKIGVKCVIAAGWAVEDEQANLFATTFYERLIAGDRFLDAVAAARFAAWLQGGNTWAAYQCYGDPNWELMCSGETQRGRGRPPEERYASVGSDVSLLLALEEFTTNARYDATFPKPPLEYLERTFGPRWGQRGKIAEAFGRAWSAVGMCEPAIKWFEKALAANDGTASLGASDALANLRARNAWSVLKAKCTRANAVLQAPPDAIDAARTEIDASIGRLQALLAVQVTAERLSLCASAYKRLAFVEHLGGGNEAESKALAEMTGMYTQAEQLAQRDNDPTVFYPLLNRLVGELVMNLRTNAPGYLQADVERLRESVEINCKQKPDFWSIVARAETQFYDSVKAGRLACNVDSLIDALRDLKLRISATQNWGSVLDQCEFVLAAYASRNISEAEQQASAKLLQTLSEWAEQA
ncbi:hypothetical protein PTKU46_75780 [Paraburkholderia terrae]|uniref:CHAT domain-containing protein n=1 Tax=Paraburkholderia terrae TaxID=311230 RepID=UPI0030DEA9B5